MLDSHRHKARRWIHNAGVFPQCFYFAAAFHSSKSVEIGHAILFFCIASIPVVVVVTIAMMATSLGDPESNFSITFSRHDQFLHRQSAMAQIILSPHELRVFVISFGIGMSLDGVAM